jgi:Na+-transporting NADH:ubiquinone oxidoreductase subunit A
MKLRGGYNVHLAGRPTNEVRDLPAPERLYLPLRSRRFTFSEIDVTDGQKVACGDEIAKDPGNFNVPLLAPYAGTVRLDALEGHVVLEDLDPAAGCSVREHDESAERSRYDPAVSEWKRRMLLELGAWQFFADAHTGTPLDPSGTPGAILVTTVHLDPHVARGDVLLRGRLDEFARGLEHLQSFLEYQPIYVAMSDIRTDFASEVREKLRGHAFVNLVAVPRRYPYGHPVALARHLGLTPSLENPVWALTTAGVLAVDRVLTTGTPAVERIVAVGGPAIDAPTHVRTVVGQPIHDLIGGHVTEKPVRVVNGGIMTGGTVGPEQKGLCAESTGLTVLVESTTRPFLGWIRPGWGSRSYSKTFASEVRPAFPEKINTALRGELRPCISCGQCVDVCPAGIMPNVIHKYIYAHDIESTIDTRVDLCFECGLCSYICPSKIDLRQQFIDAKKEIQAELEALLEEVEE